MEKWRNHIFGLKDVVIFSLLSLLVGMIAGFFIAPIKKGMTIGCNNGNNYISKSEAELLMTRGRLQSIADKIPDADILDEVSSFICRSHNKKGFCDE